MQNNDYSNPPICARPNSGRVGTELSTLEKQLEDLANLVSDVFTSLEPVLHSDVDINKDLEAVNPEGSQISLRLMQMNAVVKATKQRLAHLLDRVDI